MRGRRVVVTGAGLVSPLGDSPGALGAALLDGRRGVGPVELFATDGLFCRVAGEVRGFSPAAYLGDGNFRPLDRTSRLATVAAHLALAAAGLPRERREGREVGLVLGTMFGSVHTISEFDRRGLTAGPAYVKPLDFANSVINAPAGQTAIWHGLTGINSTLAGGPTAGLQALGYAADLIRTGHADLLLAGGADELCFESFYGFARAGWLAPATTGPPPAPFAADRSGFVLGEGAALLVLEEEGAARARGARILARVLGHGSAYDPSHGAEPASASRAVGRAVLSALEDGGLAPESLDALSTGGSGSLVGDRVEALGLAAALGPLAGRLPACAVKASTGEALGASGALQAVALLGAMESGVVPGIAGLAAPEPGLPLALSAAPSRRPVERGLVTAAGLDGGAAAVVLGRFIAGADR
jgi:3-oxoacyl-[acyl-carrier-protein] synthase II